MPTIGIGGAGSGVGKTLFAGMLLGQLPGWGALKYTRTALYTSVTEDEAVLKAPGKDTARLLTSGASKVVWVQSPGGQELEEALSAAMGALAGLPGVVIEGNSAVEVLKPDIVIFIGGTEVKKSAHRVLDMARIVYYPNGAGAPEAGGAGNRNANAFYSVDGQKCLKEVLDILNGRT
ncbi:MAG: hypothetical protein M0Z52_02795 [Actinomycetota bacterium]|nr:hypothetical protein [Actinomycetota bacterium]